MIISIKPFLALMRRATRCGYPELILNNRMLMQCYDLGVDSDVGLHYIMHIPDEYDPLTDFYDRFLILNPRAILKAYSTGKKTMDTERKEKGLKPKACTEELEYHEHKHHLELEFRFFMAGDEVAVESLKIPYPISENDPLVENCATTYNTLASRIKAGGACLAFDGGRMGLQPLILDCPEIYRYRVKYGGKKLFIPFTRSMFLGIKEFDRFLFSVQETLMDEIYVFSVSLEKKGLIEQFWGYLLQY